MTIKNINPFVLGKYESPSYFCDREKETKKIINAFKNQRNMTLISDRRIGKTGLIQHVFYQLKGRRSTVFFYIDLMHTSNLAEFVQTFAKAIIGKFDSKTDTFIKNFSKVVKSVSPVISFDPITGNPKVEISLRPAADPVIGLDEIFSYLQSQKVNILVAFDEFQQILNYPEQNIEAHLRARIQQIKNCNFIFSGSQKHLLMSMFTDYSKPFYQSTDFLNLEKIDRNSYKNFIKALFSNAKIGIEFQTIDLILDITSVHTYYVQYLCNRLYAKNRKSIGDKTVINTLLEILQENEVVYYNYRSLLTEYQFTLLKAIASEEKVKMPTSKGFIQKYSLGAASSVQTALTALLAKELIFEEQGNYRLYDVFFSKWLERY